jgi:hypothetical protein
VGQTGYTIARLSGGALTLLPPQGLGPFETRFLDMAAPPGPDCYFVLALGTNPQAISDLECAFVGFHTPTGAPQDLTLRLNQSTNTSLSWSPPTGGPVDSYAVVVLGGPVIPFAADVTSANVATNGLTCYAVAAIQSGAVSGYTDIVCGLPGFSNLGAGTTSLTRR